MELNSDFYITLPSDASPDTRPDNSQHTYTVDLPHALKLSRNAWEVGVSSLQIPITWKNISKPNNVLALYARAPYREILRHKRKTIKESFTYEDRVIKELKIPERNYTVDRLVRQLNVMINEQLEIWKNEMAFSDKLRNGDHVIKELVIPKNGEFFYSVNDLVHFRNVNTGVKVPSGDEKQKEGIILILNPLIADMLGFTSLLPVGGGVLLDPNVHPSADVCINYIKSHAFHNLYIYSNIVEDQIVGHSTVPLLTHVPVSKSMLEDSVYARDKNPIHYLKLKFDDIRTVTVLIRDDTGKVIPFTGGRTVVVLHFRKL